MQAKGAAKDVGKNLNPGSSNLPSPGAAADKASGAVKGLASDTGKGTKNVSLDLSEDIPNLFKDVGKNAEKVCIPSRACESAGTRCRPACAEEWTAANTTFAFVLVF